MAYEKGKKMVLGLGKAEAVVEESKCNSPCSESDSTHVEDDRGYVRHDDLSCTAAEVSPPGRDGVGCANNCCGEHGAHPELGGDEGGQREADEEADDEEAGGGVDNGETVNRRRNEKEEGREGEAGPEHVAGRPRRRRLFRRCRFR
ncbi:hypothetical protein LOK49_LG03G00274 [Camellia lanceoleosa]|uniref:Uncharacterized protein n=1 Tax=Camellia lanceoleosa TaxID=1840588 RepID=A0ACC0IAP3_9ERIC|nr:hypothetical protein LOK49_LG03G00274 [Camellia lanceoleosa]